MAQLDAMKREEREAQKVKERKAQREFETLDQNMDNLIRLETTLTETILLTAGFHQHKRQWRKRKT